MLFSEKYKLRALELYEENKALEVFRKLADEFKTIPHPNERTLRRWKIDPRLTKVAMDKTLQSDTESADTKQTTQQIREHFVELSHIATDILGGIGYIRPVGRNYYRCYGIENKLSSVFKMLSRDELVDWLQCNMIATYNQNSTLMNCFQNHMAAENSNCEDMSEYIQNSPVEFFKLLQFVAVRKTFKGTCDICRDWQ